jgi:hypothetical protein
VLEKPEFFRMPEEGFDGAMIIFPRLSLERGGGLEVMLALKSDTMNRLQSDEAFMKTCIAL